MIEIITSADNQKIKAIKKLLDKKHRDKTGLYVAEGTRWVSDAAAINPNLIQTIVLRESAINLAADLPISCQKIIYVSDALFSKITDLDNSQGILAVLSQQKAAEFLPKSHCLFLDKVRDPGNLGTIIRTAAAAGYDIICNDCADVYNPKAIRSSMTAVLSANIFYGGTELLSTLKQDNYKVFAGVIDGENVFEFKSNFDDKICIAIGNEADGISQEVKNLSDYLVKIPMQNVESLNAAVSAGILMYTLKAFN